MIKKHTKVPYTIYGSVNRLQPEYRRRLQEHPEVRICHCPETDLRRGKEHAFYLDHLIEVAVQDGASHIVTLHLDSFPISAGWAGELADRLSPSCVFATIDRINTACLFFHRDFYLQYHPRLRLSAEELASPQYKRYLREWDPIQHSGIGYGFKAYAEGLSWYYLNPPAGLDDPNAFGLVYDGLVFHLRGATMVGEFPPAAVGIMNGRRYSALLNKAIDGLKLVIPKEGQRFLRAHLKAPMEHFVDRPQAASRRSQLEQARQQLLEGLEAIRETYE